MKKSLSLPTYSKVILVIITLALIGVSSYLVGYYLNPSKAKYKASLVLSEGDVSYKSANQWKAAKANQNLKEGDEIKVASGRAVVEIDDGSAVRLNANSTIKLSKLDIKNVVVTNQSGDVYTRVMKSDDRKFSVNVDDKSYQAMGTAYMTSNSGQNKCLEVYHSKVKASTINANNSENVVEEGKKLCKLNISNKEKENKILELAINDLKKNEFVKWCKDLDKKKADFKDKLGILAELDKPDAPAEVLAATNENKPPNEPTVAPANKPAVTKKYSESTPKETTKSANYWSAKVNWSVSGSSISLSLIGAMSMSAMSYSPATYTSSPTPNGFKLVWSKTPNPTYPGSSYHYYGEGTTYGVVEMTDNGPYYVRVCRYYTDGICREYSNQITVSR